MMGRADRVTVDYDLVLHLGEDLRPLCRAAKARTRRWSDVTAMR
eukprot:SAG22_NODE_4726_length_1180_cov_1.951896_1_plen_44_part_00